MKQTSFFLIIAFMLFIPSINLDAMENSTVFSTSLTTDPKIFTISDNECSSESGLGSKPSVSSQNFAPEQDVFEDSESFFIIETDSNESENSSPVEMDAKLKEAIDFCRQEGDGFIFSSIVSHALNWALKQTITPEERTTARKEMAEGLCKLKDKNKNNFEELEKLTTEAISETLKTGALISALKILEKINKRLKASYGIIHNKAGIQINEKDRNDFCEISKAYLHYRKTIFGIYFNFGKNNLFRKDQIRLRIQKKSLQAKNIDYEPLSLNLIITQVAGVSEDELTEAESSDTVGNDSDFEIDKETKIAADHYSSSWSSLFNPVKQGLAYACQLTIEPNLLTTAKKEMTDALQNLIQRSKDDCENTKSTVITDEIKSLIKRMRLSEKVQRKLEASRFILENNNIQLDEKDLAEFNDTCTISQISETNTLKQFCALTQDRVKEVNEMCIRVRAKSFNSKKINYDSIGTSSKEIFTSAMQSFRELTTRD